MDDYIRLGKERLIPPAVERQISQVERKARQNLNDHSFQTVWGMFVPFTAFESWEKQNEEIRKEFYAVSSDIGTQYNSIVATVKDAYSHMAIDVWGRLYPNQGNPTPAFIENFVNKIISKIPSRTEIITSFKYDVTYFVIPMPSMIESNLSKARALEREREAKDFQAKLEEDTKKKISNEYVKRKQELIDGFLESTVSSMRKYIAELCDGVLQSMARQSSRSQITVVQRDKIKKMIEKVRLLNFYEDKEMTQLLVNLETEIDKLKGERDSNEIMIALQKISEIGINEFQPVDFNPTISSLEV
ncbi:MAG: hypothetical protein WC119_05160 [Synergistaceae bacterium]